MRKYPKGNEFDHIIVPASLIKIDKNYQRPLDEKRVQKIVNEFNGNVFNEPKLSLREDGSYYCFDGGHSIAAWQIYHGNRDEPIYCKCFYGMTENDEIEAFVLQNGFAKNVADTYKLRAKYNRKDIEVVDMVNIINDLGWDVDFGCKDQAKTIDNADKIDAVVALYKAYMKLGAKAFKDMMMVIRETWGSDNDATSVQVISGMKEFYRKYYGSFKHNDLVSSLRKDKAEKIIQNGRSYKRNGMGGNCYARAILSIYNYKRKLKLEDKL